MTPAQPIPPPGFINVREFCTYCKLDTDTAPYAIDYQPEYPFLVPAPFASRIQKNNWFDPLLLQVLPRAQENGPLSSDFSSDAVGDLEAMPVPGLLHKYHGRALLLVSNVCAIHCRYCLRRCFPFSKLPASLETWAPAMEYLQSHHDITEVILSGGDPFQLSVTHVSSLLNALAELPQIQTIRIHTRVPVVAPHLISKSLIDLLSSYTKRFSLIVVVHTNHAQELDEQVCSALTELRQICTWIFNQSVLLKGINDSSRILTALSRKLLQLGVQPYYLHQLDRVQGTAHFEVSEAEGKKLANEMQHSLPGYAVPRYVREIKGAASKVLL